MANYNFNDNTLLLPSPLPPPKRCSHRTVRFHFMADQTPPESPKTYDPKTLGNYPVPLSPPLPSISKDIELSRAISASSRSSLFAVSRSEVLFEDEWLIAVNKPQGVYCEAILSSIPNLLNGSVKSDELGGGEFYLGCGCFLSCSTWLMNCWNPIWPGLTLLSISGLYFTRATWVKRKKKERTKEKGK